MLNTTCAHRFRQVSMAVREGMASGNYPYGHASRAGTTAARTVHLWCSAPQRDHGPAPRARAGIGLTLDILMGTLSKSSGSSGGFIAIGRGVTTRSPQNPRRSRASGLRPSPAFGRRGD